LKYFFESFI